VRTRPIRDRDSGTHLFAPFCAMARNVFSDPPLRVCGWAGSDSGASAARLRGSQWCAQYRAAPFTGLQLRAIHCTAGAGQQT
jgi:hypothetical protein